MTHLLVVSTHVSQSLTEQADMDLNLRAIYKFTGSPKTKLPQNPVGF